MTRTLIEVDPKKVTLAPNVRLNAKGDNDFVATIKDVGILQPPLVVQNDAGGYDVVVGQRRTLGAIQAGLKTMPAILVDQHEADAVRIVEQLTENEQRQHLTNAERLGGYQQLALIGWTPDEITKKTRAPRKVVDAAIQVGDNETVRQAIAAHGLDLVDAAALVEFADDKKTTEKLIEAAGGQNFRWKLEEARRARARNESAARAREQLKRDGVATVKPGDFPQYGYYGAEPKPGARLTKLTNDKGKEITPAAHKKCPGHGAYVDSPTYADKATIVYVCTDWQANGHTKDGAKALTEAEAAEQEAAREKAQQREEQVAIARTLRLEFIRDLLAKNPKLDTLPGSPSLIATAMLRVTDRTSAMEYGPIAHQLLTTEPAPDNGWDAWRAVKTIGGHHKNPYTVMLAVTLAAYEASAHRWLDTDHEQYFTHLVAWGHKLTDVERGSIEARKAELQRIADEKAAELAAANAAGEALTEDDLDDEDFASDTEDGAA